MKTLGQKKILSRSRILRISKIVKRNLQTFERVLTLSWMLIFLITIKKRKILRKKSERFIRSFVSLLEQTRHEYSRAFFSPSYLRPFSPIVNHVQRGRLAAALGRWPTGKPYIVLGLQSEHRGWINLRRGRLVPSSSPRHFSFSLSPFFPLPPYNNSTPPLVTFIFPPIFSLVSLVFLRFLRVSLPPRLTASFYGNTKFRQVRETKRYRAVSKRSAYVCRRQRRNLAPIQRVTRSKSREIGDLVPPFSFSLPLSLRFILFRAVELSRARRVLKNRSN